MTGRDTKGAPPIVLVNAMFARRFFPTGEAVGGTTAVALGRHGELLLGSRTIVGVVGDAVHQSPRDEVEPTMYIPLMQYDVPIPMFSTIWISTRTWAGSPAALAPSVAAALAAADKNLAFSFRPLEDQVNASFAQERLVAMLSAFFGVLALLLAALGLYGVTAYAVSRRRVEIGIRMALGAAPGSVVRLVLSRMATLVAVGVVAGAGVSVWASKFVAALLYGLAPRDPATLAGAALVLVVVATLAAWLPARRAARIDPVVALRYE